MKDQPPIFFNRYQHPFGHTSGSSEAILTDPIYRLVAGGETSLWIKPSCDISPGGDERIILNREKYLIELTIGILLAKEQ
jgi:hypothetical protein